MAKKRVQRQTPIEHTKQECVEIPLREFLAMVELIDNKEEIVVRLRANGDDFGRSVLYVQCVGDHKF